MKRSTVFWILAFVITAGSGVFQRLTGPTYPLSGTATFEGASVNYHFDRSFGGSSDAPVVVPLTDSEVRATLLWKRHNTEDAFAEIPMDFAENAFKASLPAQAPLVKLDYQVQLQKNESTILLPPQPLTIRFKGEVPLWVIIPHVLAMFGAMLFSLRAGFEFFMPEPAYAKLVGWTIGLLLLGGFIFGPLMSYYAFDLFWTGWPVGSDLTDNKTLIALIGWVIAAAGLKWSKTPGAWVVAAAGVMFAIFLIPHSIS